MLALCLMLSCTYYAHFNARIIRAALLQVYTTNSISMLMEPKVGRTCNTSHLDDVIFVVYRKPTGVFPVNHSMPSSDYNLTVD